MHKLSRKEILEVFGDTLRAYRSRAGLSQEKLAAKAGLDRTYVGGVERGERNVALVNIVRLAETLGIRPAQLLEALHDARTECYSGPVLPGEQP